MHSNYLTVLVVILAIINLISSQTLSLLPRDCADPSIVETGEYTVYPDEVIPVRVFCDVNRNGWTQIMNKVDRTVGPFNKSRLQYQNGFGSPTSDFWIGLNNIRALVAREPTTLRIELGNGGYWIEYDSFHIGAESENYRLYVDNRRGGNLIDSFSWMNGFNFFTYDYDGSGYHACAKLYSAGWWFNDCHSVCLTCEKKFTDSEGHWSNGTWLNFQDAKMFIKPKYKPKPANCYEIYKSGRTQNGIYNIYLDDQSEIATRVYCEMSSGGWTRVLTRNDRLNHSFSRNYQEYKTGFGDVATNHWLGLRKIRTLVTKDVSQMRIELSNDDKNYKYIIYDTFTIGAESDHFTLHLGPKLVGDLFDAFRIQDGYMFSAFDSDQDILPGLNCAQSQGGGWWFTNCYLACLTCSKMGVWSTPGTTGGDLYFSDVKMMIKPKF